MNAQRVLREIRQLQTNPPPDVSFVSNDHITSILAEIKGPKSTPFEDRFYSVRLRFPSDFPRSPPTAVFETPIFHPNISPTGDVCVNTLKRDWNSETSISHVFQVIVCLLIEPYPESALNEVAARLAIYEYEEYFKRAKLHAQVHGGSASVKQISTLTNDKENVPIAVKKVKKSLARL
ncbi:hypothetical protein RCL1_001895 [Eukaryota sp. TZLM3-RCL]